MTPVSHETLMKELKRGAAKFVTIERRLAEIAARLEVLPKMQEDIAATKEIVEAYSTVKNVGRFVKWAGGLFLIVASVWAAIKVGLGTVR